MKSLILAVISAGESVGDLRDAHVRRYATDFQNIHSNPLFDIEG